MDPVKLVGDILSVLTFLAVVGAMVWFVVTQVIPFFG